jgi:choline dehydrogenase-like flavoprotein
MSLLRILQSPAQPQADLKRVYDAIVIGSGAAGGMAAHVLTSQGMKVLMLEAGKKLDIDKELKSMEWPFQHPRRGGMPPDHHALTLNEYTIRQPPYAAGLKHSKVFSYVQGWSGPDYSKNIVVNEKDHPYTGSSYAWVRARCLGGKTNIWGRLALRLSDYDFKARTHDGYGEDWPISYKDIAPYYDRVDEYLGISGVKENLPYLPDSIFQRPTRLNAAEVTLRSSLKKMGRVLTPYRAGVTTEGLKHNKYRSRCFGRGACARRTGGCDIHAVFDSPTGLIYPAMDTGSWWTARAARPAAWRSSMRKTAAAMKRSPRSSWSPRRRSSLPACCCSRSHPRIRTASVTRADMSATTSASTSWGRA